MKDVFIEQHQAEFNIKAMCRVLRVARSGRSMSSRMMAQLACEPLQMAVAA